MMADAAVIPVWLYPLRRHCHGDCFPDWTLFQLNCSSQVCFLLQRSSPCPQLGHWEAWSHFLELRHGFMLWEFWPYFFLAPFSHLLLSQFLQLVCSFVTYILLKSFWKSSVGWSEGKNRQRRKMNYGVSVCLTVLCNGRSEFWVWLGISLSKVSCSWCYWSWNLDHIFGHNGTRVECLE